MQRLDSATSLRYAQNDRKGFAGVPEGAGEGNTSLRASGEVLQIFPWAKRIANNNQNKFLPPGKKCVRNMQY
ncbi:MAG: hypothetical protein LBE22_04005 [Azoarcus sp.]|jgi:hypothetical protein|nr:hypothetical protein [Azoarcus sp.]